MSGDVPMRIRAAVIGMRNMKRCAKLVGSVLEYVDAVELDVSSSLNASSSFANASGSCAMSGF